LRLARTNNESKNKRHDADEDPREEELLEGIAATDNPAGHEAGCEGEDACNSPYAGIRAAASRQGLDARECDDEQPDRYTASG